MEGSDKASSLAIVAIPSKDDYVWKISSEKVPHLTLCFLGDQSKNPNVGRMAEFVEHVVKTSMHKFGLDVERRGTLGDKEADVLFFNKAYAKHLEQIRGYLLGDPYILQAYNSVEQYPEWTPHLTLGYPETPANPDNRDYPGINWVNFDSIALWTGDYEGPEFALGSYDGLAMSDKVEEFLEHFGIKGMKWGVRRKRSSENDSEDATRAAEAARKVKRHGTRSLTNQELQSLVTRMNLEQQLANLQTKQPSKFQKGKRFTQELISAGQMANQAFQLANSPAAKQVAKLLTAR